MVLIPILTFIIAVLWADGKYFQEKVRLTADHNHRAKSADTAYIGY